MERRENPYTIPNAITIARMAATPVIGHFVLQGELGKATALLFVAGFSDLVSPLGRVELGRSPSSAGHHLTHRVIITPFAG